MKFRVHLLNTDDHIKIDWYVQCFRDKKRSSHSGRLGQEGILKLTLGNSFQAVTSNMKVRECSRTSLAFYMCKQHRECLP